MATRFVVPVCVCVWTLFFTGEVIQRSSVSGLNHDTHFRALITEILRRAAAAPSKHWTQTNSQTPFLLRAEYLFFVL